MIKNLRFTKKQPRYLLLTFNKINFFPKFFQEHYQCVIRLGSRSGQSIGPDLGPYCLQRLSEDDKSHR